MKRWWTAGIFLALLLHLTGCFAAEPQATDTVIRLSIGEPTLTVNGERKPIDENGTVPVIVNDRTLLPIRAVIEAMGGTADWNGQTREVVLRCGDDTVRLTIDSFAATHNGAIQTLDTAPTIINDRTMLPIRFIAECFAFSVDWDAPTQTVTVRKQTDAPAASPGEQADQTTVYLKIGDRTLLVRLADNSSAKAFYALLEAGDLTLDMEDYGGFEKGADLPESLPRNDERINTDAGDLILYQGNRFVIYYDTNAWSLTRLGKIEDISKQELQALLGKGNVTVTLSLEK